MEDVVLVAVRLEPVPVGKGECRTSDELLEVSVREKRPVPERIDVLKDGAVLLGL